MADSKPEVQRFSGTVRVITEIITVTSYFEHAQVNGDIAETARRQAVTHRQYATSTGRRI